MPPVVIGAVGVGLAAAGTVAQISQQSAAVKAQNQSIALQQLQAEDQLELAQEQFRATKQAAQQVRDRELQINAAQKKVSMLQIEQEVLSNELAKRQSQMQAFGIRSEAQQQANALLGAAQNQASQLYMQSANELQEALGLDTQKQQSVSNVQQDSANKNRGSGMTELAAQQRGELGVAGMVGDTMANAERMGTLAQEGISDATRTGAIQRELGEIGAGYIESTQALQDRSVDAYKGFAKGTVRRTTNRNKKAINAAWHSSVAAGNMELLNQAIQTRSQIAALDAQKQSGPGPLSWIQGAANVVGAAQSSGLLRFGSSSGAQMPFGTQQSSALDSLVRSGGTMPQQQYTQGGGGSSLITQMPPTTMGSTISVRPPITFGTPLTTK